MTKLLPLLLLATALTAVAATRCGADNYHCVSNSAFCLGGQVMQCAAGTHCVTQKDDKTSPCITGKPQPQPKPTPPDNDVQACTGGETIPSYKIVGSTFKDVVKGTFVDEAYQMAQSYVVSQLAEEGKPGKGCRKVGVPIPIHACYDSINPGSRKGAQQLGQYGFHFEVQYLCPGGSITTMDCQVITLNTRAATWAQDPEWSCTPLLL